MKTFVRKKRVMVPYNGYIPMLGITGPVDVPYWESTTRISNMIMRHIPVVEVLSNGETVELTIQNYDTENNPSGSDTKSVYEAVKVNEYNSDNETIVVTDEDVKASHISTTLAKSAKKETEEVSEVSSKSSSSYNGNKDSYDNGKANKVYVNTKKTSEKFESK